MSDDVSDISPSAPEITAALKTLPQAPEASNDFWSKLETAIDDEARPVFGAARRPFDVTRRRIPARSFLAVAAVLAVVAGGLALTRSVSESSQVNFTSTDENRGPIDAATTSTATEPTPAEDDPATGITQATGVTRATGETRAPEATPTSPTSSNKPTPANDEESAAQTGTSAATETTNAEADSGAATQGSPASTDETSAVSTKATTAPSTRTTSPKPSTTSAESSGSTTIAPAGPEQAETSSTLTETTTNEVAANAQLASPKLGRLVPHHTYYDQPAAYLSVEWDPVPGATGYQKFYSLDGNDFVMSETATPSASVTHEGPLGRQYCLRVVATSSSRPDSEPSVVCSVSIPPMTIDADVSYDGAQPVALNLSWTDVGPAVRYEVGVGWAAVKKQISRSVVQPRVEIDLTGLPGDYCAHVDAFDAGGNRIHKVSYCGPVPLGG